MLGGLLWSVGVTLAGYWLGSSISNVDHYLLPIIALVVLISLLPIAVEILRSRSEPAGPESDLAVLSYFQAAVIGLVQGISELFPVSSLGHSVLVPALIGGSWKALVTQSASADSGASPYLAFIVALHVATAIALIDLLPAGLDPHHPRPRSAL